MQREKTSNATAAEKPDREAAIMSKYYDGVEFPFCDEFSKYEKMAKIGQGTFGEVFKAKHRQTGKKVALKKVLMENEKEGFPITALREIKILQLLKHENVVNLIEICRTKATQFNRYKGSIYLVFDFCEHDLAGLLSNANVKFTLAEIKKVMQMLLNGLYYIHRNKILHRDMKAANVLITRDGVLKLADFGLARAFSLAKNSQGNRYTNRVVTLWYRPPELLLGERDYGPPIDLWGAGCIMAEMWTRSPIMQGNTEQHQLTLISQLCGSITAETWPAVDKKYELYQKMELPKGQKRKVKDRLKAYVKDPYALDLIDKLLILNVEKNRLKLLPESVCRLPLLQTLNLKGNCLAELPAAVGSLSSLRTLDISDNDVQQLPTHLAHIRTLESFTLDAASMTYPPASVCSEGTESIQRFLCGELGQEYCAPSQYLLPVLESDCSEPGSDCLDGLEEAWQSKFSDYERRKEQKLQEKLAFERHLEEKHREHTQLLLMNHSHKENMLNSVRQDQERVELGFSQQQRAQEAERQQVLERVRQAEDNISSRVSSLLMDNSR
uniref:Cyclin-dependent kinase 9 (CDC2-related kinase) n=1 Tax=Poecilia reticulata TaxID=8081 RepID=A0A3P9NNX6_POERE